MTVPAVHSVYCSGMWYGEARLIVTVTGLLVTYKRYHLSLLDSRDKTTKTIKAVIVKYLHGLISPYHAGLKEQYTNIWFFFSLYFNQ